MHTPLTCQVCEHQADSLVEIGDRRLCGDCATLALRDIFDDVMAARAGQADR